MPATLLNLGLAMLIALFFEFYIESKFKIRKRTIRKLGPYKTLIFLLFLYILAISLNTRYYPSVTENKLFFYVSIYIIAHFIPRKYETYD